MINPVFEATLIFKAKMQRPQYIDYQNNKPLQKLLFADCLKEAIACNQMDGSTYQQEVAI